ncbi:CPBP family intramembrane glutamic endopeptidase [Dietzia sp.]|uniref:CPBP family intramembrane glutamic endopeptidase n=1 Tax=Dietzia sp. TaxID=1871616 RepID=UPI003FA5BBA4
MVNGDAGGANSAAGANAASLAERLRVLPARMAARMAAPPSNPIADPGRRRLVIVEIVVVLAATFALSGYTSILSLVESLLSVAPLDEQTQTLNASASSNSWLDLAYQLGRIARLTAWAALPLVLLFHSRISPLAMGLDLPRGPRRPAALRRDVRWGLGLTALIGIPGIALYLGAIALGLNTTVEASGLTATWWRIPMLLVSALANAGAEELVVVVYLGIRLRQLGLSVPAAIAFSAVLRGSYHLYQGFGGGLGNLAMGIVFMAFWLALRRAWPLVLAHFLLDAFAFIGYAVLAPHVGWL